MENKTTGEMMAELMRGIKNEINSGNEALKKTFNEKIELSDNRMERQIGKIADKIVKMDKNIEQVKEVVHENRKEAEEMNSRMSRRIDTIEEEMKRSLKIRQRTNNLKQMHETLQDQPTGHRTPYDQPTGSTDVPATQDISYSSNWAQKLAATNKNVTQDKGEKASGNIPSHWMERAADTEKYSVDNHDWFDGELRTVKQNTNSEQTKIQQTPSDKLDSEKIPAKRPANKNSNKGGMKKLKHWFGDESCTDSDMSDSTDTDDWDVVNRRKKNKEKKSKKKTALARKEIETYEKTNHIIGLGPISDDKLNYQISKSKNFEEAKVNAVQNLLSNFLKFNPEELRTMTITETVISAKKDGIIYAAFNDINDIHEIRLRIAESRHPDIIARNYIPPQIYERYMSISRLCTIMRSNDSNLKTQLRFGHRDIDVMTKEKGSKEPYKYVPLVELTNLQDLPKFDHSRRWAQRVDRPPRRKINYSPIRN